MASSSNVVTDSVVAFLEKIPPFQFLPATELRKLSRTMSLEYFPRDSVILSAGRRAVDALFIVQKGAVKLALRTQVGKELVLDTRAEGELFGLLSLLGRDVARLDVTAMEDTLCYSIPAEEMQELIDENRDVADYLYRTSITRYMDRSLQELRAQTNLMGDTERLLYSLSVRDVVREPAVTCSEATTVGEAAQLTVRSNASSICVVDGERRAVGIVTDADFARKVVAGSVTQERPVREIMSSPVISVESGDGIFQALLAMLGKDIHHLLVTEQGIPSGVLTSHDLLLVQGKSPLSLARHVEQQTSLEGLATAQKRIADLLPLLLREGAKASHLTRVVAEISDRVITKVLQFAEARLGPPPVPYCWVVLGSEGRREQTFKTDQDNALIYADPPHSEAGKAAGYFAELSAFVQQGLEVCGYPACTGGYMASNPKWRQPLSAWFSTFEGWIAEAHRRTTEDALIFFDLRAVAGDFSLYAALAADIRERARNASFFKSVLAFISIVNQPPLGFFRTLVVERTGEHKEQLDIKTLGTGPIVNMARLFALDAGLEQTSTVDRLAALQCADYNIEVKLNELQEAFEFLTLLRIENQLQQARTGTPLSNYINPGKLTHLQKNMLKEAFRTVAQAQSAVDDRFRTAVWSQLAQQ